jgi:hypothetical protein
LRNTKENGVVCNLYLSLVAIHLPALPGTVPQFFPLPMQDVPMFGTGNSVNTKYLYI